MKQFFLSFFASGLRSIFFGVFFLALTPYLAPIVHDAIMSVSEAVKPAISQAVDNPFQAKPGTEQYVIASVDMTVPAEGRTVYADLGAMTITLFEDGVEAGTYPIKSVGREGTAWQTPIGTFDMSYKMENHFSSIGHVWMPYSMHFFGNYFIHGWPYYPDGTPVPKGYSGGCIRLETADAQQIFAFVDEDTRLIVTNESGRLAQGLELSYEVKGAVPEVAATSYLVADLATGEVVAARGQQATTTADFAKLMTAMISLESLNQYTPTTFDGQAMTIGDVLYPLLLADDADAAHALYAQKNKGQFILDMNTRAKSLGMSRTHYDDATGSSADSRSTLEDTFKLMQYAQRYKPFLIKTLSLPAYAVGDLSWQAAHPLKDTDGYVAGFVTGEKDAAVTVVTFNPAQNKTSEISERRFAILVAGTPDPGKDTLALYSWMAGNVGFK